MNRSNKQCLQALEYYWQAMGQYFMLHWDFLEICFLYTYFYSRITIPLSE